MASTFPEKLVNDLKQRVKELEERVRELEAENIKLKLDLDNIYYEADQG